MSKPQQDEWPEPGPITPEQGYELLERGACLIDVRPPSDFQGNHVEDAINIPIHVLSAHYGELVDKDCPIIVCCRNGDRSEVAYQVLLHRGLERVYDGGAVEDWLSLTQR